MANEKLWQFSVIVISIPIQNEDGVGTMKMVLKITFAAVLLLEGIGCGKERLPSINKAKKSRPAATKIEQSLSPSKEKAVVVDSAKVVLPTACAKAAVPIDPEEYQVYKAVIDQRYRKDDIQAIVISDRTNLSEARDKSALVANLKSDIQLIQTRLKAAKADTVGDFQEKNASFSPLCLELFKLPSNDEEKKSTIMRNIKIKFITDVEIEKLFRSAHGWKEFYKLYSKKAQGILTFSRVGFDKQKTQALVCAGNRRNFRSGEGFCLLLDKSKSRWRVVGQLDRWIS